MATEHVLHKYNTTDPSIVSLTSKPAKLICQLYETFGAREPGTAHHPPGTGTGQTEGIRASLCIPFFHWNNYSLSHTIAVTLNTKRFNQHISGWNLLTDFCLKHFGVTFFLLVYLSILLLLDNGVVRLAGLHKFCWSNMESHSPRWTLPYQRGVDIVYPTSVLTASQ